MREVINPRRCMQIESKKIFTYYLLTFNSNKEEMFYIPDFKVGERTLKSDDFHKEFVDYDEWLISNRNNKIDNIIK